MLTYSLAHHPRGYGVSWYEALPAVFVSPYATRHWDMANSPNISDDRRLGHRLLAALHFTPIIGALALLVERVIAAVYHALFGKRRKSVTLNEEDPDEPSPVPLKPGFDPRQYLKKLSSKRVLTMGPNTMRAMKRKVADAKMLKNFQKALDESRDNLKSDLIPDRVDPWEKRSVPRDLDIEFHECSKQGKRKEMEDEHFRMEFTEGDLYGIFDGHGDNGDVGRFAAEKFKTDFPTMLKGSAHVREAFEKMMYKIQAEVVPKMEAGEIEEGGCTAMVMFFERKTHRVFVATLGDTEAKIYRKIENAMMSIPLSVVRNWNSKKDEARALNWYDTKAKNHFSMNFPILRRQFLIKTGKERRYPGRPFINSINVSRSLGDHMFEAVSQKPKITAHYLLPGDKVVMGCDGLWDFITEEEIIEQLEIARKAGRDPAKHLVDYALKVKKSSDNVTVMTLHVS